MFQNRDTRQIPTLRRLWGLVVMLKNSHVKTMRGQEHVSFGQHKRVVTKALGTVPIYRKYVKATDRYTVSGYCQTKT